MHCNACVTRVERALSKVEGASDVTVTVGSATAAGAPAQALLDAIVKAGYTARVTAP